jgi:hypothetical protein
MDRSVIRRLMPIPFNRTTPEEERIQNIGQRIVASSKEALKDWAQGADLVLAWLEDRVLGVVEEEPPRVTSADLRGLTRTSRSGQGWKAMPRIACRV